LRIENPKQKGRSLHHMDHEMGLDEKEITGIRGVVVWIGSILDLKIMWTVR